MNANHTQGPWIAKAGTGRWNVTTSDKPRTFNICSINTDRVEQEANAKLIAAAPELLAALVQAERALSAVAPNCSALWDIRAVIAKATS